MADSDADYDTAIQPLESYEIRHREDNVLLRLWSDREGRPVEFTVSTGQITMLKLVLQRAEMVYDE